MTRWTVWSSESWNRSSTAPPDRQRSRGRALALFLALWLGGCGILGIGYDGEATWEVASYRVTCFGPFETTCLQVRAPGDSAWENFYGTIRGFDYQEGFEYLIRVGWHEIQPVPDGPSREYRLIRLIEKKPAPVP